MVSYRDIEAEVSEDVNRFASKYMFFAFSDKDFASGMAKLGFQPDETGKIRNLGGGSFIRADKIDDYQKLIRDRDDQIRKASKSASFAFEMFCTELANHEYPVTGDPTNAILATGYTMEEVNNNPVLRQALHDAEAYVMQNSSYNRAPQASKNTEARTSRNKRRQTPPNVQSDPGWTKDGAGAYSASGGWRVEKVSGVWNLWGPNGFSGSYPTLSEAGRFVCLAKSGNAKSSGRRRSGNRRR